MAILTDLPPELILLTVSFLTREVILDPELEEPNPPGCWPARRVAAHSQIAPDLPSINALCQTNTVFYRTLNQILYDLCASVETLGKRALLFAIKHQLEGSLDRLVAAGISLDTEFPFGGSHCSPLHLAAGMGLRAMVIKLLGMYGEEMTARVHARHRINNYTALDYAVREEHMEIVRLLAPIRMPGSSIPPSSVPDSFETPDKQYLGTALVESVQARNLEIIEYLISEGADVNFSRGSPLHYAAGTYNLELVQLLLASGADPNLCDVTGRTPIFNAAGLRNDNVDIVQALLAAGANIHAKNDYSRNVLVDCANVALLRFFLERGVDPNNQDIRGETALHHACQRYDAEFAKTSVELLLRFGAGPVETNRMGHTAVDFAMQYPELPDVVKILEPFVQDPNLRARIAKWWGWGKSDGESIG